MSKRKSIYRFVTKFKSRTSKYKWYSVKRHSVTGELSCNCPGWTFKKGTKRKCRHVTQVVTRQLEALTK